MRPPKKFWALKDINFEVNKGDRLGIIGRNGAGKSTLLKLLSKITEPSTGSITLHGRVASLLEVGTGFHPELTGRENVFMNGVILGMTRNEIKKKFDEIVAFAEVEKFLDTPVKRYSSGMYVRLAFAVAAHLEPEILVVDEVLAVGDAQFQKKCLGKMEDVAKNEGRTVLFVSHNMTAIKSLCSTIVVLEKGGITFSGETQKGIDVYLQNMGTVLERDWEDPKTAPGNELVRLKRAAIIGKGEDPTALKVDTPIDIKFEIWNLVEGQELNLSMHVKDSAGIVVFADGSPCRNLPRSKVNFTCHIPKDIFNDNTYSIMLMVVKDRSNPIFLQNDLLSFSVEDLPRNSPWLGKWPGALRPHFDWNVSISDLKT